MPMALSSNPVGPVEIIQAEVPLPPVEYACQEGQKNVDVRIEVATPALFYQSRSPLDQPRAI
jgi:hypothetical protein